MKNQIPGDVKELRSKKLLELSDNNEIRYLELSKRNKLIYTVLYIVYSNIDEKDIVGYVVSDNYGNISLLTLNNLCKLIESYPCMSYYLITKNNKYFIRKYHNLEIATIKDSGLKEDKSKAVLPVNVEATIALIGKSEDASTAHLEIALCIAVPLNLNSSKLYFVTCSTFSQILDIV